MVRMRTIRISLAYMGLAWLLVCAGACSPKTAPGQCDPYLQECLCHAEGDCTLPWVCAPSGVCELPHQDAGPPDVGPVDSSVPDAAPDAAPDAEVKLGFGEPCSDKLECESYICIFVATGGFCSMLCQAGSCPTGYGCVGVWNAVEQGVVSDVCIPEANLLCTQCATHNECSLIGQDLCLPDPLGGSFCGRDCTVVSCPTGYSCEDIELAGLPFKQCLPESGSCNCTAATAGNTAPCDLTTPFGTCQGIRECLGSTGWGACEAPATADEPDENFTDENCDGIDGQIDGGIYVAISGTDDAACGPSYQSPCQTINYGISRAAATGRVWVYIQAGTYYEVIALAEGVHLVGGFDASWQRAPRMDTGHTVTVVGGVDQGTSQYMTVRAYGLGASTRLLDLVLVGPTAFGRVGSNGKSSYVLWAVNSSGLSIERVTFQAGNGVAGLNGTNGLDAPAVGATLAMNGGSGGGASSYSTTCDTTSKGAGGGAGTNSCTGGRAPSGGAGGAGGTMDTCCSAGVCTLCDCNARAGTSGTNASVYAASSYGYRGTGSSPCNTPTGGNGGRYDNGAAGTGGAGGYIADQFWYANGGTAGTTGDNGTGGGGGGGSGGCDDGTDSYGAGGGGGSAGGCAARGAGTGGGGGGGSFGLFLVSSSVTATECVVIGGNGADGGNGGTGGQGQSGGIAGNGGGGTGGSQAGGAGGVGSHGGHGGGGGGGSGGVSFGVYGVNSPSLPVCTFSGGARGIGGQGGLSAATAPPGERDGNNGPAGQSAPSPSYQSSCSSPPVCN